MSSRPLPSQRDDPAATGRERILREARARFTAEGYAAVSMQRIADAAGVNKATLYHHFADKEALFLAVLAAELDRLHAAVATGLAADAPLRERLTRAAAALLGVSRADLGRLMAEAHQHAAPEARERLTSDRPPPWDLFRPALEAAAGRGELAPDAPDPATASRLLFGMLMSEVAASRFADAAERREPTEAAAEVVRVLLGGIGRCESSSGLSGQGRSTPPNS